MNIDDTSDDVAVALAGKAIIYDSEGIFKDTAGKDTMPGCLCIIGTAIISWWHDKSGRALFHAHSLLPCLTHVSLKVFYSRSGLQKRNSRHLTVFFLDGSGRHGGIHPLIWYIRIVDAVIAILPFQSGSKDTAMFQPDNLWVPVCSIYWLIVSIQVTLVQL